MGHNMTDVSPDPFMDAVLAYQQTAAIKAALELDLFSEISKGHETVEGLARVTGAAVRGVRILCDYLTARGHLEKYGDQYRLTRSTAAFLDRRAPSWMGSAVEYLAAPEMMALFLDHPAAFVPSASPGRSGAGGRGIEETSASFEVRSAPRSYPTNCDISQHSMLQLRTSFRAYQSARMRP
jgi:hypothetical protein